MALKRGLCTKYTVFSYAGTASYLCYQMVWQGIQRSSQWENETTGPTVSYCWQTSLIIRSHLSPTGEHTYFVGTATVNKSPHWHSSRRWLEASAEEHGCNKWKILACLLLLPRSQVKIVRCGGCYDPQLFKRSSEWVSEWVSIQTLLFVWDGLPKAYCLVEECEGYCHDTTLTYVVQCTYLRHFSQSLFIASINLTPQVYVNHAQKVATPQHVP